MFEPCVEEEPTLLRHQGFERTPVTLRRPTMKHIGHPACCVIRYIPVCAVSPCTCRQANRNTTCAAPTPESADKCKQKQYNTHTYIIYRQRGLKQTLLVAIRRVLYELEQRPGQRCPVTSSYWCFALTVWGHRTEVHAISR